MKRLADERSPSKSAAKTEDSKIEDLQPSEEDNDEVKGGGGAQGDGGRQVG